MNRSCSLQSLLKSVRSLALVTAFGLTVPHATRAQSSIVPATHSIYDWLHTQRIFGRLPNYSQEIRPASRATILEHLKTLERDSLKLSGIDRGLLREFLTEFDMDRLLKNGLFRKALLDVRPGTVLSEVAARRDPYLYAGRTADSAFSGALWFRFYGRGEAWEHNDPKLPYRYAGLWTEGGRAFVNYSGGLGVHAEFDGVTANEQFIYYLDPKLSTAHVLRVDNGAPKNYEAWVSFAKKYYSLDLGVGAAQYGPAITDPLVFRPDGPNFSQFRARIGTQKLNYLFTYGQLLSDSYTNSSGFYQNQPIDVRLAPLRWVAMQRLTWNPLPILSVSLHSMNIAAARGGDLRFLNPVLPQLYAQNETGNLDNLLLGYDVVARPLPGTEVFASMLVDDSEKIHIFPLGKPNTKVAASFGLEQRLPLDFRLGLGYLRVDAFAYTSYQLLSAWQQDGLPNGPVIGPNADETSLRLSHWLPLRTRVMAGTRRVRKGLNPINAKGVVTTNVGGDLNSGLDVFGPFMTGSDMQIYRRHEVEFETEPIRGFRFTVLYNRIEPLQGTRVPATHFYFLRWSYGV